MVIQIEQEQEQEQEFILTSHNKTISLKTYEVDP